LARYRGGEEKLFGFFMGQVMRATKGKADPNAARQRLQEMLQEA
jgi:aspartyl-tRNA(Asn)/glutamyl-tRNA(Gln) amidotransferase subunit B